MAHVTFVHGIGNKPPHDPLLDAWERSLAYDDGIDLGTKGITSNMVYWADVMYPEPKESALEAVEEGEDPGDIDLDWKAELDGDARDFVASLSHDLGVDRPGADDDEPPEESIGVEFEAVPLPRWLKKRLMASLLRDVHHYLFNARHQPRPEEEFDVQDEIRARFVEALEEGARRRGPHIVVSHSMGTVISYECLKRVEDCPTVDGLVTIGSPLGIREIPSNLRPDWSRNDGFPTQHLDGPWINVFDHFDPVVGASPHLRALYRRRGEDIVTDVNEQNWGKWRHSVDKYLQGAELRRHLGDLLGA